MGEKQPVSAGADLTKAVKGLNKGIKQRETSSMSRFNLQQLRFSSRLAIDSANELGFRKNRE